MRVLLLGAGGMLGHEVVATAPAGIILSSRTRVQLDITDYAAVAAQVAEVQPHLIVNAAAYTEVDQAESERDLALGVNGKAVGNLGRIAARTGAKVVHFSSDYVFDGTATRPYSEEDPPHPVNAYGESKLAGELALRASGADMLIIRTQWLFGPYGRSFPRTMWERAKQGVVTRVVSDQTGRPTYTRDLVRAMWQLVERTSSGVVHIANSGSASWYDVASHIFALLGRADLVTPCAAEYHASARRPMYSVLGTRKAEEILGMSLPSWSAAVARFVTDLDRDDVCDDWLSS